MAKKSTTSSDSKGSGRSRIFVWILGIVSFGLLAYLLAHVAYQMVVPPPAQKLLFVNKTTNLSNSSYLAFILLGHCAWKTTMPIIL